MLTFSNVSANQKMVMIKINVAVKVAKNFVLRRFIFDKL
jgi:hypothetical protein